MQEPHAICKLYRSLGPAMVARLHGDFAFVLHDSRMVSYPTPLSTPCQSTSLLHCWMQAQACQCSGSSAHLWKCQCRDKPWRHAQQAQQALRLTCNTL